MKKREDLTFGEDLRGNYALFIEEDHINGLDIDIITQVTIWLDEPTFFRVIKDGIEQHGHGWIENGKIIQWG